MHLWLEGHTQWFSWFSACTQESTQVGLEELYGVVWTHNQYFLSACYIHVLGVT